MYSRKNIPKLIADKMITTNNAGCQKIATMAQPNTTAQMMAQNRFNEL
jgi:hypothetical protein